MYYYGTGTTMVLVLVLLLWYWYYYGTGTMQVLVCGVTPRFIHIQVACGCMVARTSLPCRELVLYAHNTHVPQRMCVCVLTAVSQVASIAASQRGVSTLGRNPLLCGQHAVPSSSYIVRCAQNIEHNNTQRQLDGGTRTPDGPRPRACTPCMHTKA